MQIKGKKKTAWSGVYYNDEGHESDYGMGGNTTGRNQDTTTYGDRNIQISGNTATTGQSERKLDQTNEEDYRRDIEKNYLRNRKTTGAHAETTGKYTGIRGSR
eukprot:797139-Pleurochrysis_carterae.AAC.1